MGVSQDTQERNDQFRKTLDLPYPLVGDPRGEILKAYRVRWPIVGLAQRVTYLVARDHRVRFAFWSEFNIDAHMKQACDALESTVS